MRMVKTNRFVPQMLSGLLVLAASNLGLGALAQEYPGVVGLVPQGGSQTTGVPARPEASPEMTPEMTGEAAARLVLSLSERRVRLYRGAIEVVSYPVAVGKPSWETPTGEFQVYQKVINPTWRHPWNGSLVPPGPDNPLGDRWVGFLDRGQEAFGFHGTTNESLIGEAVSHGCVRMKNADVTALFEQIEVGTPVVVQP